MVEIKTMMSRHEIEQQLKDQGYILEFVDRDDQIWMNKEQDELLFMSWINGSMWVYKRTQKIQI